MARATREDVDERPARPSADLADMPRQKSAIKTKADLRQLAYRVTGPKLYRVARDVLRADNYGTEWCLTDILGLEAETRMPLVHALTALDTKGRPDPEKTLDVQIALRSVSGQPVVLTKVAPEGEPPPNMTDADGIGHHRAVQWQPQHRAIPAAVSVSLVDLRWFRSALWLLSSYGWRAREGGMERLRWVNRRTTPKQGDQWLFVEDAYRALHPEDDPLKTREAAAA